MGVVILSFFLGGREGHDTLMDDAYAIISPSFKSKLTLFPLISHLQPTALCTCLLHDWMQSDPYIEIAKVQEGGAFTVVYRSQPIMKTLSPRYFFVCFVTIEPSMHDLMMTLFESILAVM